MSQKTIAIISTLKPVNDIRSYEKMARSLASKSTHSITLIGSDSQNYKEDKEEKNIHFQPLPKFDRLGIKRFFIPCIILKKLIKLKPELIIVNTPELLIVSTINQILFGGKIVYDLQENHYKNLIHQHNYPPVIKHIIGYLIRLKEVLLSPFVDYFILAEKGYVKELGFIKKRFTIVENKTIVKNKIERPKEVKRKMQFLFTGNISENSGVFTAIDFYRKIHNCIPETKLVIIGHSPSHAFLKKLKTSTDINIELIASTTPVSHSKIVEQIASSDFGIVSYNVNPSNENCMPTKVFEYLAYGLPIISQSGTIWTEYASGFNACVSVDFKQFGESEIAGQLVKFHKSFTYKNIPEVRWETEENKFVNLINALLNPQ
ncbi:glycosyltransferase [Reichenbachiella sp. MALMAid0571]|uniref:glycosyltransferase n=1 Tax=Reichenbachiella sp. MALMAid0571 TaxID=3143939 RepID=UPI0032DF6B4C